MILPADVREALAAQLGVGVAEARAVYGGDINQAAQVTLSDGERLFIKWNPRSPEGMFAAEAHGLRTLAAAEAIRVPAVIAVGDDHPAYLAMAWIEEARGGIDRRAFAERFGRELAALHQATADQHGLARDNYIGFIVQPNTPTASWIEFYRERRIGAQMDVARRLGRLPRAREQALTRLQEWLDVFLDDEVIAPSLLHGDLWSGNYMVAPGDEPVLVDPAAYYGHREVDLAMTELFGGFPPRFYAAYDEVYPLDGYDQRRLLYQLYPLIVHLNHFGGGYGARVDAIARHYVG